MCVNHFINVLITSTLLCFILSVDSISWDKYTRYILFNDGTDMLCSHDSVPIFCLFLWKGEANYAIGCEDSYGKRANLAEWAQFRAVSDFIIEELNEKSCEFQPCLRLKTLNLDESYCLDISNSSRNQPSFTLCESMNENQKWTITAIDDREEPAHFLIKATSTASEASLSLNKQELETNDEWTEPASFLIQSTPTQSEAPYLLSMEESGTLVYVKNQMTQSAATYHSPNVHPTTEDQTFGNSHIDSTTTHSTVSKTLTGSIRSTMPVLTTLNQAKLFTNPTGNQNSKLNNSKKSTTMNSFVPINHATSKKQKEYAFPTNSSSMYATTSYLIKDEAKTPSITTTMPIPKNEGKEPANFMIKTTSTPLKSSPSSSIGEVKMFANNQLTSKSVNYGTNQIAKSAVTTSSHTVRPSTKNQILGNIYIDSTTTYSTDFRTRIELLRTLKSLNGAKFFINSTGDISSKVYLSKKSAIMTSSIPLTNSTSKKHGKNAFPTISMSMYTTTSYTTKSETKTLSGMLGMLISKSGKVATVGNQDDTGATSMATDGKNSPPTANAQPIADAGSLNLLSPLSTVKQCESTCPQEVDNLFKNCYDKEHVFYNGTKTPCNPMPETHQIVSKLMNMFGSMWVVGTSMTSAVLTLCMMPKLFVNQIQCGQDIILCLSHLMIMFFVFRVDNQLMCKLTATSLIILLSIYSSLAMLECICVYLSLTNTLNSWNTRLFRFISCIFILCLSVGILTYLICFSRDLPSDYSCWINYNNHVSKSTLTVAGILFSISMIFIETGISGMHKSLPTMQKEERKVCEISSATLFIRVILSTASYILTSYAVFSQNFALFPASFGINVAFGWFNFFAHAICNKEVNAILVRVYCYIKTNLMEMHLNVFSKH